MITEEQIKRITECLNDLDLEELTRDEMDEQLKESSFNDIEQDMWRMYCFIGDVCDTLNM